MARGALHRNKGVPETRVLSDDRRGTLGFWDAFLLLDFCVCGVLTMGLEISRIKLGFVPLVDAAPLIVARDRGFFAEQGLEVELSRQASWASIRDKVAVGALDGAHMLAPMPLEATLGLGNCCAPVIAAVGLNTGGNAITFSNDLFERVAGLSPDGAVTAAGLKAVIEAGRAQGAAPLSFAVVYPFSSHAYELRYWLASGGIDPDRDVRLVVVPPPQMVAHLSAGRIHGYCVGEPWNRVAVTLDVGKVVVASNGIWGGRLEKVLGVREDWADAHPHTHKALIKALLLAGQWADQPENRMEVAGLLSGPGIVNAPLAALRDVLADTERLVFHRHAASFPWRSQALWYLGQMRRWGQLGDGVDMRRAADRAYRSDIYRMAALELDWAVPLTDSKSEGAHAAPWVLTESTKPIDMAPDAFIDGAIFNPDQPQTVASAASVAVGKDL